MKMDVSRETKEHVMRLACEVRQHAYAPYSNYLVGAALLTKEGTIFLGCNVENASYGLTCCAERVAIFKALSEKVSEWVAIAIVTKDGGAPCGACRQVMNEFNPDLLVWLGDEKGHLVREMTLKQLLPDAFGPYNLI